MTKTRMYRNERGNTFEIEIEETPVPEGADYWGFIFKVREQATNLSNVYKAVIKKHKCATLEHAELFVKEDPLAYLKSTLLNNYEAGSHPIIWPDLSFGWGVI